MKFLITGGTGFVGSALVRRIRERKDAAVVMTRDRVAALGALGQETQTVAPDASPPDQFAGVDAVVNLMGEPIFGRRWSEAQKERLRSSRVEGTKRLVAAMASLPADRRPKAFVSGSAVGWYGPRGEQELDEGSPGGDDFLAGLCREWEAAALEAAALGVRAVVVRVGVVLGPRGGALEQMLPFFRLGLGGPIGSGRQWFSWIHRADLVSMILWAASNTSVSGVLNGTAPEPVTNAAFAKSFGRALRRPAFLPTPPFALRLKFGESASILTSGQRVLPRRATAAGFSFAYPTLDQALNDIVPQL